MINLLKQEKGFTRSTFKGILDDKGVEQIPEELKEQLIQVDEETLEKLKNRQLMWKDGELVTNPNYQNYANEQEIKYQKAAYRVELNSIQKWFTDNDWKPNKIVTGEWTTNDERWIGYLQERAIKRARQDELNNLLSQ